MFAQVYVFKDASIRRKGDNVKLAALTRHSLPISLRIILSSGTFLHFTYSNFLEYCGCKSFHGYYCLQIELSGEILWLKCVDWLRYSWHIIIWHSYCLLSSACEITWAGIQTLWNLHLHLCTPLNYCVRSGDGNGKISYGIHDTS
jgi:hypothetical protein